MPQLVDLVVLDEVEQTTLLYTTIAMENPLLLSCARTIKMTKLHDFPFPDAPWDGNIY